MSSKNRSEGDLLNSARVDAPPAIGIAIPAYRAAETLGATLRSCIAQTRSDWIAYVTVDGDDAAEEKSIAEGLHDPRIVVEGNQDRLGQFANFNRAILRCHANGVRWIKLLCADDCLQPDALERMVALGESVPDCGLVFGFFNGMDAAGNVTESFDLAATPTRVWPSDEFIRRALPLGNPMGGPTSILFRADAIERCGLFSARLDFCGESELFYRIASSFSVGLLSDGPIANYRYHRDSVSGRGHLSAARFRQPMDIGRATAALFAPYSLPWFAAQRAIGRWGGILLLTGMANVRRGHVRAGLGGIGAVLRRLSLLTAPIACCQIVFRLVRAMLGLRHSPISELEPEITPAKVRE